MNPCCYFSLSSTESHTRSVRNEMEMQFGQTVLSGRVVSFFPHCPKLSMLPLVHQSQLGRSKRAFIIGPTYPSKGAGLKLDLEGHLIRFIVFHVKSFFKKLFAIGYIAVWGRDCPRSPSGLANIPREINLQNNYYSFNFLANKHQQ